MCIHTGPDGSDGGEKILMWLRLWLAPRPASEEITIIIIDTTQTVLDDLTCNVRQIEPHINYVAFVVVRSASQSITRQDPAARALFGNHA